MTAVDCKLARARLFSFVNGFIGEITADNDGQHGSFPPGPLNPGNYYVDLEIDGDAPHLPNFNFNFSGTITVNGTTPINKIQWDNPSGGSFHTDTNWDPQTVPGINDTAVFGLASAYSVDVGPATTERLEIRNGDVTFTNATYTVAATAFDPAGILLDNSALTLEGGSVLFGAHALIGESAAARVDVLAGALNLSGSLRVGGPGNGILNIEDGLIFSGEGRIGTGVGGGTVMASGVGSSWGSGSLAVGYSGPGTLIISDGATVASGSGFVGLGAGTAGDVTIEGSGPDTLGQPSTWRLNDGLTIGADGTGLVQVLDFGVMDVFAKTTVNGTLFIADGALSSHNSQPVTIGGSRPGEVTVSGFAEGLPGRMNTISDLTLGESAAGSVTTENGGFVSCTNATLGTGARVRQW